MTEVMAEMGEVSLPRTQQFGESHPFDHIHVRRVCSAAGSSENQGLNSFEDFELIRVDRLAVAQVGRDGTRALAEQKTKYMGSAMLHPDWMDCGVAKRKGTLNQMRFRQDVSGK